METFSVTQFFIDDSYETVRNNVTAEEAMLAFNHYTHNVAVRTGITARVIVTDSDDYINAEWKKNEGYTYPPELVALQAKLNQKGKT